MIILSRTALLLVALVGSLAAGFVVLQFGSGVRPDALDWSRIIVVVIVTFWLIWGSIVGVLGALVPNRTPRPAIGRPAGRTAILVPIYNEDPNETFARLAAMNRQLVDLGVAEHFHFVVLSDSTSIEVAATEVAAFERLVREPAAAGRFFYRRREVNVGKKAGNIEDFVARSGAAYDYAIVLDADSLMEGETLLALALRMDADTGLGLLQTVPRIIGARSIFGRMMAFSAAYLSPSFARGIAVLQDGEGPYWGHNAIVRMAAFAQCCGLPTLSGRPPYGGYILSHDYVEAALLARGGWRVEVDPFLGGSYEHGPDNLQEYVKRDRRWCQGNLQHRRLLLAPGLRFWNRFTLAQGVMAYLVSPLWLILMATSLIVAAQPDGGGGRGAVVPWMLGIGVVVALLLPKLAVGLRGAIDGTNRRFGGSFRVWLSLFAEIGLSTLLAPILLAFQTRAVIEILLGLDGGWPATARDAHAVAFRSAWRHTWWISLTGLIVVVFAVLRTPDYVHWLLPAAAPALLAPFVVWLTSRGGRNAGPAVLFDIEHMRRPTPVMLEDRRIVSEWTTSETPLTATVEAHA